jgi:hypothetical protein
MYFSNLIDNHYDFEFLDTTTQEALIIPPLKYVISIRWRAREQSPCAAELFHLHAVTPHSLSFPAASESEEGWTGALPQM